ncbi:MAG: SpvB/TcaC N-terminal domain-containing protein [Candidatus Brocadiaceae bacterium]
MLRTSNLSFRFIFIAIVLLHMLTCLAFAAPPTKSGVRPQVISLPTGPGAIEGLGESFEPQLNTGTGKYAFPIAIPPGRAGFAPDVRLSYDGGNGNGGLGMGWSFSLMCVKRQTDKGLPRYNDPKRTSPDAYINEMGEELVKVDGDESDEIQVFRLKNEGAFTKYEYILSEDRWVVTDRSGRKYSLGSWVVGNTDVSARIKHPKNNLTYAWYIGEAIDTNGNQIFYKYVQDQSQIYCKNIQYSTFGDASDSGHIIEFTYESRPDPIVDYRPTFRLVTAQRMKQIDVKTGGTLVRRYKLEYLEGRSVSLLSRVTLIGADGTTALPPAEFQYTNQTLAESASLISITGLSLASILLTGENPDDNPGRAEILDFNGDGLPDLYQSRTPYSPPGEYDVLYVNQGNGKFLRTPLSQSESLGLKIQSQNSFVQDINGDGLPDLVAQKGSNQEDFVFRLNNGGKWASSDTPFKFPAGVTAYNVFKDPDIRTLDINFDKQIDTLRSYYTVGASGQGVVFTAYLNKGDGTMDYIPQTTDDIIKGIHETFDDAQGTLVLADMNGDRMQDIVLLNDATNGGLKYWPSTGFGKFDDATYGYTIPLTDGPDFGGVRTNIARLELSDLNGDGLADLYYVSGSQVRYWLNESGVQFGKKSTVNLGGSYDPISSTYRLMDIDGDGLQDILFYVRSQPTPDYLPRGFGYIRLFRDNRGRLTDKEDNDNDGLVDEADEGNISPNLLCAISNGTGRITSMLFGSHVEDMLRDRLAGNTWTTIIPFPVSILRRVDVFDGRNSTYTREITYHDGYYDGKEKEFRGFEKVEQREVGDDAVPDLFMAYTFDTGATEEALKGKPLELMAMDSLKKGTDTVQLEDVFYREDYTWETRILKNGANGDKRNVTFPFQTVKMRDISEKGNGTPVQLKWEYEYDDYGNMTRQTDHGRMDDGWDDERVTETTYTAGYSSGLSNWILGEVVESITTDENGIKAAHKRNYYDGLGLGEVSKGNLTKVEDWVRENTSFITSVRNDYDDYGNIIAMYDPLYDKEPGHYRQITYDTTYHTFPVEENIYTGLTTLTMLATYDPGWGVMKSSTDYNGYTTTYDYDTFGRLISMTKPPDAGHTVEYDYKLAQPVGTATVTDTDTGTVKVINWVETRQRDGSPGDGFLRSRTFYDGMGRKIMTRAEGEDAGQVVVTDTVQFNARKLVGKKYLPYFDGGSLDFVEPKFNTGFTEHFYDALGREIQVNQPVGPDGILYAKTTYKPLEKKVQDEEQTKSGSIHERNGMRYVTDGLLDKDGNGRLREVFEIVKLSDKGEPIANPVEWQTTYSYDLLDNLTGYVDSQNNKKTMEYDGLKRKVSMDDPDRGHMDYTYDDASNLRQTIDAKGQTIRYKYDGVNRLMAEYYGADKTGPDVEYHYDVPGEPVGMGELWQHNQAKVIADVILNGGVSAEKKQPPKSPFVKGDVHPLPPPAGDSYSLPQQAEEINSESIYDLNNDGKLDVADVVKAARIFPQSDTVTAENTKGFLSWVRDQSGEEHNSYDSRGRVKWVVKGIYENNLNHEGHEERLKPQSTQRDHEGQPPVSPFIKGDILSPAGGGRGWMSPLEKGDQGGCKELPKTSHYENGAKNSLRENTITAQIPLSKGGEGGCEEPCKKEEVLQGNPIAPQSRNQVPLSVGQASPLAIYDVNRGRLTYLSEFRGVLNSTNKGNNLQPDITQNFYNGMEYDSVDRITKLVYPDGTFVNYAYNSRGLLESVPNIINKYDYNPSGQNKELALACGTITKYDYDHRLRLSKLATNRSRDGLALQDLKYTYDGVSNITRIDDERGNETLDVIGKELGVESAEARKFQATQSFIYDSLYRLTQATNPDVYGTINHRYDRIGNMIKQDAALLDPDPLMNLGVMTSGGAAGTSNRIGRKAGDPAGPHAITGTEKGPNGALAFIYDDNGNMLTDRGMNLGWDFKDRLINLTNGSTTASYTYDYTDTRKRKVVSDANKGAESVVLYIDKMCEVRDGKLVKYIYAGSNRIARSEGTPNGALAIQPSAFYLHDHLGSTNLTITNNANVAEQMVNYPFGHERYAKKSNPLVKLADYKFTGKETDGESGLQYFEARYLGSYMGRFISVDPLAENIKKEWLSFPKKMNIYSYTMQNPIIFIDPSGLENDFFQPRMTPSNYKEAMEQEQKLNLQAGSFYNEKNVQRDWELTPAGRLHKGADMATYHSNTPIPSPVSGKIEIIVNDRPDIDTRENIRNYSDRQKLGNLMYIRGDDGRRYEIGHMRQNSIPSNLKPGMTIHRGELIGYGGTSGNLALGQTDPHVHFQIRDMNSPNSPLTPEGLPQRTRTPQINLH